MLRTLTFDEILALVQTTPEQAVYDWKVNFVIPSDDEKRGEFIKDLAAIANGCSNSYGFIIYGVDPRRPDPIIGITHSYDDSKLQQLAAGKIDPMPEFLYYEVLHGAKTIGVLQVKPTRKRPHIIQVDLGKIRKGQILVRRGSSTDGVNMNDLIEYFYGASSGYFPQIIEKMMADSSSRMSQAAVARELRATRNQLIREMGMISGVPLGPADGE